MNFRTDQTGDGVAAAAVPRPAPRLAGILMRGGNNFDLIRLVAAMTVIFGHSFYVFPTGGFQEPVTMLVKRNFSGTLAVGVFFFISGMLISQSFQRSNAPLRFVTMRAARIYPGAIVCLFLTVFGVGALVTSLPVGQYLTSAETLCYLRDNWSFFARGALCQSLPGVFGSNHFPTAVNGSLWTLQSEIVCYIYVLVLGCLTCLRSPARILITLAAILALHAVAPHWVPYFSDDHYTDTLKVGLFFMAGVAAFAVRDWLVIRLRYFLPLAVGAALLQGTAVQEYALYTALFYGVLVAAAAPRLRRLVLPGDYSFGVYIYGWPIQQSVQHFWPELTSYPSNLICIPVALLAGYLSWTLVEHPALRGAESLVKGGQKRFDSLLSKTASLPFSPLRKPPREK
ncbi:acyltransferase [Azorhizobium sp. AG788]|uniref:acyltransferase family protein n=1 Tax=Azorhizobium sp. AG788 TaxID=2183897 RepID=UPI003138990D